MSVPERTSVPAYPSIDMAAWQEAEHDTRVMIADGTVKLTMRDKHLHVEDGPPRARRTRKIPRVNPGYDRLLILGRNGYRTTEAERWLNAVGIPWAVIDTCDNRDILATSGPQRQDARLLRAQAFATVQPSGLEITRYLLGVKLSGQSQLCRDVLRVPGAAHNVDDLASELVRAPELDDCRSIEGAAAIGYWQSWADRVSVPFSPVATLKAPVNWVSFTGRASDLHPYPRNIHATNPVNAMLNYLYRIAESEAVIACHALGLSPLLGVLHADKQGRDSFALDLIEAVRPFCDRIVLAMLDVGLGTPVSERGKPAYLDLRWFTETGKGQCKLAAPLTHKLASYAADIGAALRPHAEHTARILANAASGHVSVPRELKSAVRDMQVKTLLTSSHPARLREGVTATDVIPDDLWQRVRGFIPEPPNGPYGHRKTGKPRDTSLDREVIAACATHELLSVPWGLPRISASIATCRARLLEWQWSQVNGSTAWEHIASEVQGFGHLAGLIAN